MRGNKMYKLTKELSKQGIKQKDVDVFKLYSPDSYDNFTFQAKIDAKIAGKLYAYKIKIANKRG